MSARTNTGDEKNLKTQPNVLALLLLLRDYGTRMNKILKQQAEVRNKKSRTYVMKMTNA